MLCCIVCDALLHQCALKGHACWWCIALRRRGGQGAPGGATCHLRARHARPGGPSLHVEPRGRQLLVRELWVAMPCLSMSVSS